MSIVSRVQNYLPEFLRLLEESVNMDSPSRKKALGDVMGDWYAQQFQKIIGGEVERIPNPLYGDQIKLKIGEGDKQILLVGHYDTVWPEGEALRRPFTIREGRAFGPGVYDMKAGLLQAFYALRVLIDTNRFPKDKRVVLFINSDEEIGSPTSRAILEEEARRSAAAFVLEPPLAPRGALKTWRKGSGRFTMSVKGISAHAGVDHEKGVSAIQEMSHQIQQLHSLTNYETGTTVNVGLVSGGIGGNVVADYAEAEIDVRMKSVQEAERIKEIIMHPVPSLPGTTITVKGDIVRPPMERTKDIAQLFQLARKIGIEELGMELEEGGTGGVSDGNFVAINGVPVLDGVGARGDYAHSEKEYVQIDEIPARTALLARLIEEC